MNSLFTVEEKNALNRQCRKALIERAVSVGVDKNRAISRAWELYPHIVDVEFPEYKEAMRSAHLQ
jgi:hypothetical protein